MSQGNIVSNLKKSLSITRRNVLKSGSLLAASVGGMSLPFTSVKALAKETPTKPNEKIVWSSCTVNCGSRCPLRMHVVDGEIKYVETDNTGDDIFNHSHQVRACLRGRSMRQRVYNPDRLKYPLKRIGKRGEGKFQRISWDEAFDIIGNSLKHTIKEYGNDAVYLNYGTGTLGGTVTKSWDPSSTLIARMMNLCGGYLNHYGDYSAANIERMSEFFYGSFVDNNSIDDVQNADLCIMFGNNPAETRMSGGGQVHSFVDGQKINHTRTICIDPRYTDTAGGREDQWVPIKHGTDAALCAAIAHVLITENKVDQAFLDKYCVGYDAKTLPASAPKNGSYKDYILGNGNDNTAKTPEWAAPITGIPSDIIIKLAREIGNSNRIYITQGWGLQRSANGEQACKAIMMLSLLRGQVGLQGGGTGAREGNHSYPFVRFPKVENPIKTAIPMFLWTDAIFRAHEMTDKTDGLLGAEKLNNPIKFIWNYAGNCLINQHSDINRTHDILQDEKACEMIVVIDNHMTSSAKYADIVLPDCTTSEQSDFCMDGAAASMPYFIFASQAIKPRFECKPIYDIMTGVAKRMGVEEAFTEGRTQEEWLQWMYAETVKQNNDPHLPDYDTMRKQGIYKKQFERPHVPYEDFRANPEANPLPTPSGKIEIYSEQLATIAKEWELDSDEHITPIPEYHSTFNGWDSKDRKEYPLQLTGFHYKARAHSTYGNVALLKAAAPQELWMNPIDAQSRGIKNGDLVNVRSKQGELNVRVKVTPRIMPHVTALGEGAWYSPNSKGVDQAGSINVLTTSRPSPLAKSNPSHTNLVEVKLVKSMGAS
ncbi:dimethyl sulfoxide reductase subunit A [Photobacterium angustum]|uniref:Dimethyl sulfoxide reductase subunit A n=1 Tax=Photobacterium angustum TaxID=661 RepID=A0A2T3QD25_PHOAN|nr:DmsA/YnfE/YnfF family dimethyl sulfoxide reductase [Photobacterium angustum]PSV66323.1 dimethyl sulfoxide reductase subunit A [Photobacterium angustum]PSV93624.1 dimethyl sulfoxide reductase subunit A [Photobacterium angustum]PSW82150.1 dimethyl sulfoxide reductase subunit A [Photobacterium angustum]PSW91646.1 dimethyl sulfoxide reductase subunit A [Photobacterium angustum]PSW97386.1 dimethyl sulfoxide reductase subunit A [Photobacterium angustum]